MFRRLILSFNRWCGNYLASHHNFVGFYEGQDVPAVWFGLVRVQALRMQHKCPHKDREYHLLI